MFFDYVKADDLTVVKHAGLTLHAYVRKWGIHKPTVLSDTNYFQLHATKKWWSKCLV